MLKGCALLTWKVDADDVKIVKGFRFCNKRPRKHKCCQRQHANAKNKDHAMRLSV